MQTHPLTLLPEPVLREPTITIDDPLNEKIQKLIPEMFATMKKERGVGLAATQIGLNISMAVISAEGNTFTLINPEIITRSEERALFTEGCLSIPGVQFDMVRHERITVRFQDENNKLCKMKLRGFLAVIFQHEIDHLNGIVIADKYKDQEKTRNANDFENVTDIWR